MANPFLFMEDDSAAMGGDANNDAFSNPFLVDDDALGDGGDFSSDNPFFSAANNPFAFGETDTDGNQVLATTTAGNFMSSDTVSQSGASLFLVEDANSNEQHVDATMTFFGTTINQHDGLQYNSKPSDLNINNQNAALFDDPMNAYSSEEELKMKRPPPRPNPPVSQATQQMISTLTDHLDQTSSHLLGRLPVTRTPSPVSMRDLHSPSPTPDNQLDDFLGDVSDQMINSEPQNYFNSNVEANNFMGDAMNNANAFDNDNPFASAAVPQEHKPTRPPPPRPAPPRPTPPKGSLMSSPVTAPTPVGTINTATVAQSQIHHQQDDEQDLFDLFGTNAKKPPPKPPAPKSKEDIMSLFSAPPSKPQQTQQIDLMSGDIDLLSGDIPTVPETTAAPPVSMPSFVSPAPVVSSLPQTVPIMNQEVPPSIPIQNHVEIEQTTEIYQEETEVQQNFETEQKAVFLNGNADQQEIPTIEESLVKSLTSSDQSLNESGKTSEMPSEMPDSSDGSVLNMQLQDEKHEVFEPTQNEFNPQNGATDQYPYSPEIDYAEQSAETVNPFAVEETIKSPESQGNIFAQPIAEEPIFSQQYSEPVANDIFSSAPVQAEQIVNDIFSAAPVTQSHVEPVNDIFGTTVAKQPPQKPKPPPPPVRSYNPPAPAHVPEIKQTDDFDAFSAKFESKVQPKSTGNAFLDSFGTSATDTADAWGDSNSFVTVESAVDGFGNEEDGFDTWNPPAVPEGTPFERRGSKDSDDNKEFNVFIKPKEADYNYGTATPVLAPPPQRSPPQPGSVYSGDSSPRVNPFDATYQEPAEKLPGLERTGSQDSGPPTPLFDEDVSQPLEDFPRIFYHGEGWEMQLRQPNKKKITGQRFWKKIWVRMVYQGDNPVIQLSNSATDKDPFQELPLQACYSVSEIGAQQFDNFGKIFTIKLQYVFYKERPGVRPGQVTKAERLTNKLSKFAAYAIQGDYEGCKEFGSDLKKLGLPVEHAPQVSQLFKLGSMNFEDMKQFSMCIDEALFKLNVHRDRALTYKMEEVQITAVDELYVEQNADGAVTKQIARVRLFFLGFLSGMPDIELGVNDLWRQGKEVVGRHDIIPVVTEEWIRLEGVEFHACVQQDQYERTRTIKFKPPDACYIELMRFRVRPPKNRELPLQLKAQWVVTGNKVQLRADVLVPGFASRKLGQIPCEDVAIRFPIPECWIYLFRVEKHFRYGSVKSTHRRTGKIKGIERFLGTVETLQESLIEVTSGQAKYEHHHRAIVWRCPRLPKEGQGAYTTHQLVCRLALTSFDQIPEQLAPHAYVEFTMPATTVSHTTVRSVSVQESDSDEPPEKYVRYLARMEYMVGIEHTQGESQNAYLAATSVAKQPIREEQPMATTPTAPSDSDSDSN